MHRFNFPRLAAVLVTAVVVFAACAQGPGTAGPRGPSDTAPAFAVTVADQTYTEGEAVSPLTLPEASGGNGTLSYSLAPTVPGLTFVTATRTLSGTPTSAGNYDMTYQAVDGDNNTAASDAAMLSFTITVQPAATLYVGCSADAETWRGLRVCSERPRDGYDRDAFGTGYSTLEDDIIAPLPPTTKENGQVYTPYSCIALDITPSGTAATDIDSTTTNLPLAFQSGGCFLYGVSDLGLYASKPRVFLVSRLTVKSVTPSEPGPMPILGRVGLSTRVLRASSISTLT